MLESALTRGLAKLAGFYLVTAVTQLLHFPGWLTIIALLLYVALAPGGLGTALTNAGLSDGTGLYLNDDGVTLGARGRTPDRLYLTVRAHRLHYHAPWSAIYDATLITDPKSRTTLTHLAWRQHREGRVHVQEATHAGIFPLIESPLLTF